MFNSSTNKCGTYPDENKFADNLSNDATFQSQFVDYDNGVYTLAEGSLGDGYDTTGTGANGRDIGVLDFQNVFMLRINKAINGTWDLP